MIEPSENPAWPTTLRSRLRDGRLLGTDGSVWVYRAVPMSPVVDARSPQDGLNAAEPLLAAYDELSSMTSVSVSRRSMAKSSYRETHALLVNIPKFFEPNRAHPLAEYLRQNFSRVPTDRRILLFGVRLKDQVGGTGGWRSTVDSVVETLVGGGTPLSDFDADFERISGAMDRAGLAPASVDDIALANAWWNHGDFPDTPMLVHADHLHFFNSAEAVAVADGVGVTECHTWEEQGVPGHHAITFAAVQDLDLPFLDVTDSRSNWVSDMISSGALVVSVRGQVEPSKVTRDELRRQRKRFIDDIQERAKSGKMERNEQTEMEDRLAQVEALYSRGGVPPTLAGASIVVGLDGIVGDINQVLHSSSVAKLAVMNYRQPGGMGETMLCSNIRTNPNLHDLPTQVVAYSGMPSLNLVGDSDGAAVGFTERDRQIALLSPTAASVADTLPLLLGAGATGSGKTQLALHLLTQYAKMGRPGIFIDPKALTLDTPIPTPDGWTTMGEVAVGQQVFDRHGKPCNVTHKSRVFTADETSLYEIVLNDGQVVRADQNHQWVTYTSGQAGAYRLTVEHVGADEVLRLAKAALSPDEDPVNADAPGGSVLLTEDLSVGLFVPHVALDSGETYFRVIKEIRPVASQAAQCIRVDSPDHTYVVADGIVTHNTGSDHSPIVLASGGQVASLDELTAADGIFDPIRFSATKEVGVELAASLLMSVNPWGHLKDDMEVPLQHALSYGVQQGATCIGEALAAAKVGIPSLPPLLIQRVEELAGSSPMFRACVGVRPGTTGLRVAEGITLIKVGNSHLDLPEPGQPPSSISQRIALALVRMMVFGSAMALTGRKGVVMLDEAWVFLGAGRSEVERLGRLARSQQVLPMLWTQRVSDAVNAGLSGYISRGLILPIEDKDEARAACELFKLEPTPERIARITAKATIGGNSFEGTAPNWNSMRALKDPKDDSKVLRGSIVIYADLAGRAIPCEVVLPKEFLDLSSTNPEDIRRREEKAAREAQTRANAAQAALIDPGPDAGGAPLDNFF